MDQPELLHILVADGSLHRVNSFRIEGTSYALRMVRTLRDFEQVLENPESPWDLVFHFLYLGQWMDAELESVPALAKAFHSGKLRNGVVCCSTVAKDAQTFLSALRKLGVPGVYYPFSYTKPSQHENKTSALTLPALSLSGGESRCQ